MKVLIDGVEIPVNNDVRIVYDADVGEDKVTLQVVANGEGLVYDLFQGESDEEEIVGSGYDFVVDIVERCAGHTNRRY